MVADLSRRPWMTIAAAAAVMAAVLLPNLGGRQLNEIMLQWPGIDKLLHFVEYTAVFLVLRGLIQSGSAFMLGRDAGAFAGSLVISAVDETLQQWSPGRNVELLDMASNVCGIAFGWSLVRLSSTRGAAVAAVALGVGAYVAFDSHIRTRDFARGLLYERRGYFALARSHYQLALEAGMRSSGLYNSLSWVEIESGEGDPTRAVAYAEAALGDQPDNADYLDTYGWALHHAGRHEEALQAFRKAYVRNPEIFCIHYHLGATYLALGQSALARFHFERQVERPRTHEAILAARALEAMGARP